MGNSGRLIFKLKFAHPNRANTQKNNVGYMIYIATREGVEFNEDIKTINNEMSSNEDYMKYIAHRPRSHGLFGNVNFRNLGELSKEMGEYKGYIYRGILSLREVDAIKLGYDKKESWELLIREKMMDIAKNSNIPISRMQWVGAFHRESGHPHMHLMFWDKDCPIQQKGRLPVENISAIKKSLTDTVFEAERHKLFIQKNGLRDFLIEKTKGNLNDQDINVDEFEDMFKEIDEDLFSEAEEYNLSKIAKQREKGLIDKIEDQIRMLEVPTTGRLKYGFMSKECKEQIDKITQRLLDSPTFKPYYKIYLDTVDETTKIYTGNPKAIKYAQNKAKDDIFNRIGNQILNCKKEFIKQDKQEEWENQKVSDKRLVQSLLNGTMNMLSQKTNQLNHEKTRGIGTKTKAQKKEIAKKMKAQGLYAKNDFNNERE